MSTVYDKNKIIEPGYTPPNRLNFGWLGESWALFTANTSLWVLAILIAVFAPIIFNAFVIVFSIVSLHIVGAHGSPLALIKLMPHWELFYGSLIFLNVIYAGYMWSGIARTAVKQVYGEPITFRDLFSGGALFAAMFPYCVIYNVLVSIGTTLLILPGLLLAGLLLPAYAMVADGYSIPEAMSRSVKALGPDRNIAMGFMFVVGALLVVSALPFGLGLLATMPMFVLISALAYRDMIGLRQSRGTEGVNVNEILGIEERQGVSLTGEPYEDSNSAAPPSSHS